MAKTGLEIIKALDTTAGEIAEIISKGHPPFEEGGAGCLRPGHLRTVLAGMADHGQAADPHQ